MTLGRVGSVIAALSRLAIWPASRRCAEPTPIVAFDRGAADRGRVLRQLRWHAA